MVNHNELIQTNVVQYQYKPLHVHKKNITSIPRTHGYIHIQLLTRQIADTHKDPHVSSLIFPTGHEYNASEVYIFPTGTHSNYFPYSTPQTIGELVICHTPVQFGEKKIYTVFALCVDTGKFQHPGQYINKSLDQFISHINTEFKPEQSTYNTYTKHHVISNIQIDEWIYTTSEYTQTNSSTFLANTPIYIQELTARDIFSTTPSCVGALTPILPPIIKNIQYVFMPVNVPQSVVNTSTLPRTSRKTRVFLDKLYDLSNKLACSDCGHEEIPRYNQNNSTDNSMDNSTDNSMDSTDNSTTEIDTNTNNAHMPNKIVEEGFVNANIKKMNTAIKNTKNKILEAKPQDDPGKTEDIQTNTIILRRHKMALQI